MQKYKKYYRQTRRGIAVENLRILDSINEMERREKQKLKLGPKMIVQKLLEDGYCNKEIIYEIQNRFSRLKDKEGTEIIEGWIEEIRSDPRTMLKSLLKKGYPDEEAIKNIQNKFPENKDIEDEEIIKVWIKGIKVEMTKQESRGDSRDGR